MVRGSAGGRGRGGACAKGRGGSPIQSESAVTTGSLMRNQNGRVALILTSCITDGRSSSAWDRYRSSPVSLRFLRASRVRRTAPRVSFMTTTMSGMNAPIMPKKIHWTTRQPTRSAT